VGSGSAGRRAQLHNRERGTRIGYFPEIVTGEDVARFVEKCGKPVKRLGTALGGAAIQAVKVGGRKKPAVVVKGGSHGTEIAGVHAALTFLAEDVDSAHEVYVIPCGSPFDFGGYTRALCHAADEEVDVRNDDECLSVLTRLGRRFYDGEHFALFHVGGMIFAWVDQTKLDARKLFYGQMDVLAQQDPRLCAEITGKRIFYPNAIYYDDGYGPYDQGGLVSLVSRYGWVGNMNGFYDRYDAPEEVRCVREFCESIKPGLVLDLHESCINARIPEKLRTSGEELGNHFLILPSVHVPGSEETETPVAEAMVAGTLEAGHKCFTRSQLEAAWGYDETDYYHGYVRHRARSTNSFFQWVLLFAEASIVVEPRMDQPCAERVNIHTTAVRAALAKYGQIVEDRG